MGKAENQYSAKIRKIKSLEEVWPFRDQIIADRAAGLPYYQSGQTLVNKFVDLMLIRMKADGCDVGESADSLCPSTYPPNIRYRLSLMLWLDRSPGSGESLTGWVKDAHGNSHRLDDWGRIVFFENDSDAFAEESILKWQETLSL